MKETSEAPSETAQLESSQFWNVQWEYHRMKTSDTTGVPATTLNELGREGWELVAVFPIHAQLNYIFKRPRPVE